MPEMMNWIAAAVAVGLAMYLSVALLKPEFFQ